MPTLGISKKVRLNQCIEVDRILEESLAPGQENVPLYKHNKRPCYTLELFMKDCYEVSETRCKTRVQPLPKKFHAVPLKLKVVWVW